MLNNDQQNFQSALHDFNQARAKASLQDVLARLTGKSNELLSYDEVAEKLKLNVRTDKGLMNIPVEAIVGSVGRYTDFTRSFLPLKDTDQDRWMRVRMALDDPGGIGLPPIDVYKVGEVYFVLDGNHRVSIARQEGFKTIQAYVIEVQTDVPLTPDVSPDDLIIKSEYAGFLKQTGIKDLRPNVDLGVTVPGQYEKLMEHIQVHRYYMGIDEKRDVTFAEAVAHWYDKVYLAVVEPVRERGLLRWFPDRTETDLYLWVSEHRAALESELGWSIRPEAAVNDLAIRESSRAENEAGETGAWRLSRMVDRYTDRLFRDILVPVNGSDEGWQALEQAIQFAQKEKANLHGLHILPPGKAPDGPVALQVKEHFDRRVQKSGLTGTLATEKGDVADRVCERALLTDLVVLNVAHPPAPGLSSLASGLRAIIARSARPVLTVPGRTSAMDNALVAFDGSQKSKEALFVAAYLAETWKTALTILTVSGDGKVDEAALDYARSYIELHELQAEFTVKKGALETLLKVIKKRKPGLVIMGSYGKNALQEVILGSAVNMLLRDAQVPLLICK
jgi:nucleotide-binding universal stress UspA family protein